LRLHQRGMNTLTFGGLALGVGMIVDASIVVLENTYRHLEMGKDRQTAAIDGSEEVWTAILASALTTGAVFLPMFFLTGISSILFGQLAAVVIFSLMTSFLVAVTLVPVLCSRLLRLAVPGRERRGVMGVLFRASEHALSGFDARYQRLLHGALRHRPTVSAAATGLFAGAIVVLPSVGFEFQPITDEGEVRIDADLAVGTSIEVTEAVVLRMEEAIRALVPETTILMSEAGGGGWSHCGTHRGQINLHLVPKAERQRSSDEIAQMLRRELSGVPGVMVRARPSGGQQMRGMANNEGTRFSVEIRGHDLDVSTRLAQDVKSLMDFTPGIADSRLSREEGRPEMAIRVDRHKAALLGLRVTGVANTVQTNLAGTQAGMFREAGDEYPIVVRLREEDRDRLASVGDVLLRTPGGLVVPGRNVLSPMDRGTGPSEIQRKNQRRIQRVDAEIETTLSTAVNAAQERLPLIDIPQGVEVGFGNEVEEQARSFRELRLVLVLAVVLVYIVMALCEEGWSGLRRRGAR
jgi:HAE1 family hydrophobic/amphiphilic exporter-1